MPNVKVNVIEQLDKIKEEFRPYGKGNKLCGKVEALIARIYLFINKFFAVLAFIVDVPTPTSFVSWLTGMDERTIKNIALKQGPRTKLLPNCCREVKLKRSKKHVIKRLVSRMDSFHMERLVCILHGFYKNNERISLKKINATMKDAFKDDPVAEWKCSDANLALILAGMGYKFQQVKDRTKIYVRPELAAWRHKYLRTKQNDFF